MLIQLFRLAAAAYLSGSEVVVTGSPNPATKNVNNSQSRLRNHATDGSRNKYVLISNRQSRLSISNETGRPHKNSGLVPNQKIRRRYQVYSDTHYYLNSMSEVRNVGNNPMNVMYMNVHREAEITPDSDFHFT